MRKKAWRIYIIGYGLQVTGWVSALVAAPFLALRSGPGWVAVGASLGILPRLLAPLLDRWLRRSLVARLMVSETLAAIVLLAATLTATNYPGWAAVLVYLAAGAVNALEGIASPQLVAAWTKECDWTQANALLAALGMGLPLAAWPLAGAASQLWGLNVILIAAASLYAARALWLALAVDVHTPMQQNTYGIPRGFGVLKDLWALGLVILAAFLLLGYLQVKVPTLLEEWRLGPSAFGTYGATFSSGMLTGAVLVWKLGTRRERTVLVAALTSMLAGSLNLAWPDGIRLYTGAALLGAGLAGLQAAGTTLLQRRLGGNSLGATVAAISGASAATMVTGAILAGVLTETWNSSVPVVVAVFVLVALIGGVRTPQI